MNKKKNQPVASNPHRRFWRYLGITVLVLFLIGGALVGVLLSNPGLEAQFGDNILRPLLGAQRVIALENTVFGLQDKVNQISKKPISTADYVPSVATDAPITASPLASSIASSVSTPPPDIAPVLTDVPALDGEGQWSQIAGTSMFTTFIRTDPKRPYAVVTLVYIPMAHLGINAMAGTKFPGGPAGAGKVPEDIQSNGKLVAAFNGGFQQSDGNYGMEVNGVTYVPLTKGKPTIRMFANGHADLVTYDGQPLPSDVVAARQNGPLLVVDGKTSSLTAEGGVNLWAGTAAGGYITWRSGLGFTTDGDLIYAVGDSLTPVSLADALRLGSSQNAIQLDINPYWVRFMIYKWNGSSYTWSRLLPGLADGGSLYLDGYEKDFFYLYTR